MKRTNITLSRNLRRNQTDAEKKLWSALRNRQISDTKFRRQYSMGSYILDFYAPALHLAIEADGGQHYEVEGEKRDQERTVELNRYGIKILRFSNLDILGNIEGVCERIRQKIEQHKHPPSPLSSPLRGEEAQAAKHKSSPLPSGRGLG